MKILMLARLYWPHVGGVEKHVEKLSAELIGRGFEITVVTEQYEDSLPMEEVRDTVRILRVPYSTLFSKRKLWQWMVDHKNLFEQVDIIHAHDVFWWYLPLRFLLPAKKIWTNFHGYEGSTPPTWKAVVHRKMVELLSTGTICVGDFMRKWYHANPDIVLYGAADIAASPLSNGRKAVFLGRLDEDTGITTYVDALSLIKDPISLDVYGDGPQADMVKIRGVAVRNWIEVTTKTFTPYRYAFVSRYLAILEAMQAKRLVVAVYNNQIKKDYLECHPQASNMIIAGTAKELANRLNSITKIEEENMIHRSYAWAKEQTWDRVTERYLSLWQA